MATPASQVVSLRELLPGAKYVPEGCEPIGVAVTANPDRSGPGSLYIHLDEFDASGAERAAERGAAAVIAERLLPGIDAPLVLVEDVRATHRDLRRRFTPAPNEPELLIVAGSTGRAVTAGLVSRVASTRKRPEAEATAVVALDPETPAEALGRARVVCLNNLRTDGLTTDGERRWESAAAHRGAIRRSLDGLQPHTTLVANADCPDCLALASRHPGPLLTFGDRTDADVAAAEIETFPGGQEFLITVGAESAAVTVATPGAAFRSNCVAAIATGLAAGRSLEDAVRAVELAPRPYGMLDPVIGGQHFPVSLDRATRPVALRAALRAVRPEAGRLIAAIRLADDAAVAAEQLATVARLADRVIATGGAPGAIESNPSEDVTFVEERFLAIAIALGLADEGDGVLIAGCTGESLATDRRIAEGLIARRLACADAAAA